MASLSTQACDTERTERAGQASWRRWGGRREDGLGRVGEGTIMNVSRSLDPEVGPKHSTLMGSTVDRSVGWRGQDIRGLEEDGDHRYRTFFLEAYGATEDPKEEEGAAEAHLRLCDCW